MRNLIITIALGTLMSMPAMAQKFEKMDKSPMDRAYYPSNAPKRAFIKGGEDKKAAAEPKIRVAYSRPSKNGREIFGKLLKFGEPWRIGANESTEILFLQDVQFGGTDIKAGRYSLIAIPEANQWTLKLNTGLDGWGNYGYEPSKDIASITAPTQKSGETIENLSIALYEAKPGTVHMKIGWDDTMAEFPIMMK